MTRIRDRDAVERRRERVALQMAQLRAMTPSPPQATQPETRAMKAKVHSVTLETGQNYLVMARTKAGALRGLRDYVLGEARVELASGEEIYDAAIAGEEIIDRDKYRSTVDPDQMPLAVVPETVQPNGGEASEYRDPF